MDDDDLQRTLTAERERIADALHDDVLPLLAVLRQDLLEQDVDPLVAVRHVDDAIGALRTLIVAEHPLVAARDDLETALVAVAGPVCSRAGLRLTLSLGGVEALEPHRDLVLTAVRELVENVARHAHARTVQVSSHADDDGAVCAWSTTATGSTPSWRCGASARATSGCGACASAPRRPGRGC